MIPDRNDTLRLLGMTNVKILRARWIKTKAVTTFLFLSLLRFLLYVWIPGFSTMRENDLYRPLFSRQRIDEALRPWPLNFNSIAPALFRAEWIPKEFLACTITHDWDWALNFCQSSDMSHREIKWHAGAQVCEEDLPRGPVGHEGRCRGGGGSLWFDGTCLSVRLRGSGGWRMGLVG